MQNADKQRPMAGQPTVPAPTPSSAPTPATSQPVAPRTEHGANGVANVEELSTVELVRHITTEVGHLAQKQIELAKAELKADLKTEAIMVGGLSLAAVTGLCTINLLLVTVVFALGTVMPGWGAGLIVSGATLLTTGVVAAVAWSRRVRSPMARTKRTLQEDVQWTKQRLI